MVDSKAKYGVVTFDYELSNQDVTTGFPLGHNIPDVKARLFFNMRLDGYGGLPPGSCLKRAALMSPNDPTRSLCGANENKDLLRNWSNASTLFEHVLIKSVEVKNAFRTYNIADGTVVKSPAELPHTDTFQSYYGGGAKETNAQWLVIQDSIIKNSDNGLMIVGDTLHRGFVFQNLSTECESWFVKDSKARNDNDAVAFNQPPGAHHPCANAMGASSYNPAPVWLIEAKSSSGGARFDTKGAPIIIVGSNRDTLQITQDSPGKICRYEYLEDALGDTQDGDGCGKFERPPFIEASCAGWRTAPAGCTKERGPSLASK